MYVLWVWTKYYDMYAPLYYCIEQFHCPKILCAPPLHPSLPQSLASVDLFTISVVLPFSESYIIGMIINFILIYILFYFFFFYFHRNIFLLLYPLPYAW